MTGIERVDYTRKDFDALLEGMLALARERLPEWTDQSPNDPGAVLLEAVASAIDTQLYYVDRLFNESFLDTAVESRSLVNLLRLIGYELRSPKPASADLVLLFDKAAVGVVTVPTNARFESAAKITGKPVPFQYVRAPLPIDLATLPLVKYEKNDYKGFASIPVVQVDAGITNEILGSSDGTAGQRFRLARTPLIDGSLTIFVDEGAGPRVYEVRASLVDSKPTDRHVAVQRDENDVAWVEFGNTKYAVIPPRFRNNITASYRVGGGVKGNVPASSILSAVTAIPNLKKVYNPLAASGGTDREAIDDAVARAPRQFRSMGRAVTAEDYASHARQFGVAKARARAAGWNRIELFVAPIGGGFPSDTLKADLSAYFESRRILTSLLDLLDPVYVPIDVRGVLFVEPYFFTEEVQTNVQNAVKELLSFGNVNFAETLFLSSIYESIERVNGVRAVTITRFNRSGAAPDIPPEGKIELGWDEIPVTAFTEGIKIDATSGGAS